MQNMLQQLPMVLMQHMTHAGTQLYAQACLRCTSQHHPRVFPVLRLLRCQKVDLGMIVWAVYTGMMVWGVDTPMLLCTLMSQQHTANHKQQLHSLLPSMCQKPGVCVCQGWGVLVR